MSSKAAPPRRLRRQRAATARPGGQSFLWSNTMTDESRDDAFKKGTIFAAAGPSEERTGFHLGQHSPPPNATPRNHAAHTAMETEQHQGTGSAQEHRATTTRAAAPASKTLTPPHPRPAATPTKETSGKDPPFIPLGSPQRQDPKGRPNWPPSTRPAAPGGRRARSCNTVRETRSVLLHRA